MDELDNLIAQYLGGNDLVRDQVIVMLMPLAYKLARRMERKFPDRKEDLRSVALYGLTQAVEWARTRMYDGNLKPYVVTTIRRFIWDYIREDHLITVPISEQKRMRKELETEGLEPDEIDAKFYESMNRFYPLSFNISTKETEFNCEPSQEDKDSITIKELHKMLGLSYYEQAILSFREAGYSLREIGDMLEKNFRTIDADIKKLQARYTLFQKRHPTFPEPPT